MKESRKRRKEGGGGENERREEEEKEVKECPSVIKISRMLQHVHHGRM